jgi:hypothetical protein
MNLKALSEAGAYPSNRRLESEIRTKYDAIIAAIDLHTRKPRKARITDIRREINILQGMVFAWFYVSGRWNRAQPIAMSHDVNNLAMYWLGVNIVDLQRRVSPIKAVPKIER